MLLLTFIINVFFVLLPVVENANILFVALSPAISHQIVFQAIWKELSLRGHKIHVITPNPLKDAELTNLTEIDISSVYEELRSTFSPDISRYLLKKPDFVTTFLKDSIATKLFSEYNEIVFQHKNLQKFLNVDHQFDVCIIEWLFPTMAAFGAKYNCPIVGVTSTGAPIPALDTVGNPSHPAYVPDHNLPVSREMTFKERVMSSLYAIYVRLYYHFAVLPREDKLVKKYLGENLPYLGDIERNISILLLNRNLVFHRIMPTVPAIIELGGIQLNKTKQILTPELKQFLDNSKNGVVYFSLGSSMKSILLPEQQRNMFLNVFSQLPYDVVWKWEEDVLPGKSANIFIQKWAQQIELLKHPNVKLFITSGGQQSTEDAIQNHVPIIGIPFHSDQTSNVDACRKYGMGTWMDIDDITFGNLNWTIHEIINTPKYKENAAHLSQLMVDQPYDGLKRAIWWIEYVIRHKGAKHLRSPAIDIGWIQFLLLDIFAFLLIVFFVISFICYMILKFVLFTLGFVIRKLFVKQLKISDKKKNM